METEAKPIRAKRTPKAVSPTASEALSKSDFYSIAKMFNAETDEIKLLLIETSARLQLVKLNLKEEPQVIAWIVRNRYPGTTDEDLLAGLQSGLNGLNLNIPDEDLPTCLSTVNQYTATLSDTAYNSFWHGMFTGISAPLTSWPKVVLYSEYIYRALVRPAVK